MSPASVAVVLHIAFFAMPSVASSNGDRHCRSKTSRTLDGLQLPTFAILCDPLRVSRGTQAEVDLGFLEEQYGPAIIENDLASNHFCASD